MEGNESRVIVDFPEINQKIAIEARTWGLAGNHEVISISLFEEPGIPDSSLIQTFYTSELYYRKKGTDTLSVYAMSSSYKDDFLHTIGNVILEVHPINNDADEPDYRNHFKELGLNRITIYD